LGVCAQVEGKSVFIGSERLMAEEGIEINGQREMIKSMLQGDESPLYLGVDDKLVGVITYADTLRPESATVIQELRELGVKEIIIATGDREEVARVTSDTLGIDRFASDVFPEDKYKIIDDLKRQGRTVAVVGDGINDSLALAHADVAVAPMDATNAAKEAAEVLLMGNDLHLLVDGIRIAKSAIRLVRQNYKIVAVPNAIAMAAAAAGILGPGGATFINNGSTVAAGVNSLGPLIRRNGDGRLKCKAEV
jgi:Cu2+-exporting ATPase